MRILLAGILDGIVMFVWTCKDLAERITGEGGN
jgi:hypothetical protein